jgi:hypothetical protein
MHGGKGHLGVQAGHHTLQHTAPTPRCTPRPHLAVLRAMLRVTHSTDQVVKCELRTEPASAIHTLAHSRKPLKRQGVV